MPNMDNLLIKDDSGPSEITFVPIGDMPPTWRQSSTSLPLEAMAKITYSAEQVKSGDWKITSKLEVPVMESIGANDQFGYVAQAKVAYTTASIFTMFASKRSTIAQRADCLKMHLGFLQGASSTTATGTLSNTSAQYAFAGVANSKPGPYGFVNIILPQ